MNPIGLWSARGVLYRIVKHTELFDHFTERWVTRRVLIERVDGKDLGTMVGMLWNSVMPKQTYQIMSNLYGFDGNYDKRADIPVTTAWVTTTTDREVRV